jgi:hypothetical protein
MNYEDEALRRELDRRTRDWDVKLRQMRQEIDQKDRQIEQQRQRAEMMGYIARRRAEERDAVAPELLSYVQGDSVEEVEQSIGRARAKTADILEGVRQATESIAPAGFPQVPQPQAQPQPQPQPQQLTLEQRQALSPYTLGQLKAVEVGSPEHMALRRQFGMTRGRGRGLFDQDQ